MPTDPIPKNPDVVNANDDLAGNVSEDTKKPAPKTYKRFTIRLNPKHWEYLKAIASQNGMTIRQIFDAVVELVPDVTVIPVTKIQSEQESKSGQESPMADESKPSKEEKVEKKAKPDRGPQHPDGTVDLEEVERFRLFMRSHSLPRRHRGVRNPERGVSMSLECWGKLEKLSRLSIITPDPKQVELLTTGERKFTYAFFKCSKYNQVEILRVGIEAYIRENWRKIPSADDTTTDFLDRPVSIKRFDCEVLEGQATMKNTLKDIPPEYPVLIDHSILLLSMLRLGTQESTDVERVPEEPILDEGRGSKKQQTMMSSVVGPVVRSVSADKQAPKPLPYGANDPFLPHSNECADLIRSARRRKIFIHQLHLSLFILKLRELVGPEWGSGPKDGHNPATLMGYLATKARQSVGLGLEVLRLDQTDPAVEGDASFFPESLVVAAARHCLMSEDFAFASAFLNTETVHGVQVFRPGDLQKISKTYPTEEKSPKSEPPPAEALKTEFLAEEAPSAVTPKSELSAKEAAAVDDPKLEPTAAETPKVRKMTIPDLENGLMLS